MTTRHAIVLLGLLGFVPAAAAQDFRIEDSGELQDVTIKVLPILGPPPAEEHFFLILFEEPGPNGTLPKALPTPAKQSDAGNARIRNRKDAFLDDDIRVADSTRLYFHTHLFRPRLRDFPRWRATFPS